MRTPLQKFAAVHVPVHNHFKLERHLSQRADFEKRREVALPNGTDG